jgi:hypothetical protein
MKRLMTIALALTLAACQDAIGPDQHARQHAITTRVTTCANPVQFNLQVSWVDWNWQAIYLKGAVQVANVTDTAVAKNSGCIYALGDRARVKLVPLGDIARYLDSAFVDVVIRE